MSRDLVQLRSLDALTGIRFFAALHVLLFHTLYLAGPLPLPSALRTFVSFGESAVSFFFILSGFILTYAYTERSGGRFVTRRSTFYRARFARIYPLYLLALLLDLPRGLSYFYQTYDLAQATWKTAVSFTGHVALVQSWIPQITPAWNSPGWSISTEAFFYLMFPLLIAYFLERGRALLLPAVLLLIPVVLHLLLSQVVDLEAGAGATLWRSFPLIRVFEFMLGIYLGVGHGRGEFRALGKIPSSVLIGISIGSIFLWPAIPKFLVSGILLNACFAVLILNLARAQGPVARILSGRVVVLLGHASFALYILHVPLLSYFEHLSLEPGVAKLFLFVFLALACAVFAYRYVELPLQALLRRNRQGATGFTSR